MTRETAGDGEKIIIYGAGGLGREILQLVRLTLCPKGARVLGFVDDHVAPGTVLNDAAVLGDGSLLDTMTEPFSLILGFAYPEGKKEKYGQFKKNPLISFPSVVHPSAYVSEYARMGEGTVIAASCNISVDTSLGVCVFFNTGVLLGHDSTVGDFTSVMPLSAISGNVAIGEGCLIGAQSAIKQGIKIGRSCVVGMGSIVLRDIPDDSTVLGNPAKKIS